MNLLRDLFLLLPFFTDQEIHTAQYENENDLPKFFLADHVWDGNGSEIQNYESVVRGRFSIKSDILTEITYSLSSILKNEELKESLSMKGKGPHNIHKTPNTTCHNVFGPYLQEMVKNIFAQVASEVGEDNIQFREKKQNETSDIKLSLCENGDYGTEGASGFPNKNHVEVVLFDDTHLKYAQEKLNINQDEIKLKFFSNFDPNEKSFFEYILEENKTSPDNILIKTTANAIKALLTHEIGHALGLKHTHAIHTGDTTGDFQRFCYTDQSIMSYNMLVDDEKSVTMHDVFKNLIHALYLNESVELFNNGSIKHSTEFGPVDLINLKYLYKKVVGETEYERVQRKQGLSSPIGEDDLKNCFDSLKPKYFPEDPTEKNNLRTQSPPSTKNIAPSSAATLHTKDVVPVVVTMFSVVAFLTYIGCKKNGPSQRV